jgi:hypothetical protein
MSNLTADQTNTLNQWTPIATAIQKTTLTLLGGFMQRKADHLLADQIKSATAALVGDQRIQNRITQSQVRVAGATRGTDEAPLDIIMQLALQGEKAIGRIRRSGRLQAQLIRNAGDQALYKAGASAMQDLSSGFAEALNRGLFAEDDPPPGTGGTFGASPVGAAPVFGVSIPSRSVGP